jgi:short-subunit dehydrogenase
VVLAARRVDALEELALECAARGAGALVVPTDITDDGAAEELLRRTVERFGRVDVWVEAASVLVAGDLVAHRPEEVRQLVDTNVTGVALGSRAALRQLRAQGSGTLIIVSSLLGVVPSPIVPVYVMSKFALRGLALSLRQAVVDQRGVHVCTVVPGPVDTPIFQRAGNRTGRQLRAIPPAYAPERLAAAIVACARRPRRQATAGVLAHGLLVGHRLAPRLTEAGVARWSGLWVTRREPAAPTSGALFDTVGDGEVHGGWRRGRVRRRLGERVGAWQALRGADR